MNTVKTLSAAVALGLASLPGLAGALTTEQVIDAQKTWGEGIVRIGEVWSEQGDYREAAADHIRTLYAYDHGTVLFKPTLAAEDQFRGSYDEALSYFVGGGIAEDGGFAIKPWTDVRWENEGIIVDGDSALAMGNYYFTQTDGTVVKVEYTFGYMVDEDGDLRINLHHSSLPFTP